MADSRSDQPARKKRVRLRPAAKVVLLAVAIAIAFHVGSWLVRGGWVRVYAWLAVSGMEGIGDDPEAEERDFDDFVKRVMDHVVSRDGYLPIRPYKELIDANVVQSFRDFVSMDDVVRFNPLWWHPVRVNPELSKNPKDTFFRLKKPDLEEFWTCYFDGTWEKIPYMGFWDLPEEDTSSRKVDDWSKYDAAGYPAWESESHKERWVEENRHRLQWDEDRSMYVVRWTDARADDETDDGGQ